MNRDITQKIERLELFEEKLGVVLQGISAFVSESDTLSICGEILSAKGTQLKSDIDINVAVYDKNERVIKKETEYVNADKFLGLETFEVTIFDVDVDNISKIRVYCKEG